MLKKHQTWKQTFGSTINKTSRISSIIYLGYATNKGLFQCLQVQPVQLKCQHSQVGAIGQIPYHELLSFSQRFWFHRLQKYSTIIQTSILHRSCFVKVQLLWATRWGAVLSILTLEQDSIKGICRCSLLLSPNSRNCWGPTPVATPATWLMRKVVPPAGSQVLHLIAMPVSSDWRA